jgi:hypothetical protein
MTNRLLIFLLIFLFYIDTDQISAVSEFIETRSILNDCGGDRILLKQINDLCATNINGGCPIGNLVCYDKNTLTCVPNCSISVESLLNQQHNKEPQCFNNGIYDSTLRRCKCPQRYSGNQCETTDPCLNVDCGLHGHCMNGQCVCDFTFSGDRCQVNQECESSPNKVWTGDQCICHDGYEGDDCDRCKTGLVCIPGKDGLFSYQPLIIEDEEFLSNIISWSSPPGYNTKPYIPSPVMKNGCKCTPDISKTLTSSINPLVEHFSEPYRWNVRNHPPISQHSDYLHRFYKHHYIRPDDCDFSFYFWYMAIFTIIVIIVMIVFCFCIFKKGSPRYSLSDTLMDQKPLPVSKVEKPPRWSSERYIEMTLR